MKRGPKPSEKTKSILKEIENIRSGKIPREIDSAIAKKFNVTRQWVNWLHHKHWPNDVIIKKVKKKKCRVCLILRERTEFVKHHRRCKFCEEQYRFRCQVCGDIFIYKNDKHTQRNYVCVKCYNAKMRDYWKRRRTKEESVIDI